MKRALSGYMLKNPAVNILFEHAKIPNSRMDIIAERLQGSYTTRPY